MAASSEVPNISPIAQGISLVRQLLPKSYAWLAAPDVEHWGFIAQDVESVIPAAVTGEDEGKLSLDVIGIVAVLVNAVKQLDLRCQALETAAAITPPPGMLA